MDGIVQDVKRLFNQVMYKLKEDIAKDLQSFECLSPEQLSAIDVRMETDINPFEGLETHYLQDKYFKEHLDYLVGCLVDAYCT